MTNMCAFSCSPHREYPVAPRTTTAIHTAVVPNDHISNYAIKPKAKQGFAGVLMRLCPRRRRGLLPTFRHEELDKLA